MAFTAYSTAAGAFDDVSTTPSLPPVGLAGARERVIKGSIALTTTQVGTIGNSVALGVIPTGAYLHSIGIQADDFGTTLTMDLGLYDTDVARTAIAADVYGSDISFGAELPAPTGTTSRNEFRWENALVDLNEMEQRVWEDGGVTIDPVKQWLIALTVVTFSTLSPRDIAFIIRYTHD